MLVYHKIQIKSIQYQSFQGKAGISIILFVFFGVYDQFGHSGPAVKLLDEFGLRAVNIVEKAKAAIALKK